MIQKIDTIENVTAFFNELMNDGVNFHPDDPFEHYRHRDTGKQFYTDEATQVRNILLGQAFTVCEHNNVDIYELAMDIFAREFYKNFPPE